ncbi:hypothetical protein CWI66_16475 [Halomonas sp. 141]|uniref:Uncharacterized protein n=1 Tax=Halomonas johnsoniae TaxID=502832 RepID=A0ABQ2WGW1_9GAMM|nr:MULTISPECIES: hypothetical protein [Halomonas]NGO88939.1 hypothetical protein [Halomonas sp.]PJX12666.1 hypothetical protein CWI66_16475 [Halomonas sp. 141]GGW54866.1 hypothetical protein GCM10007158_15200 [Halomonas johnsoniae]
MMSKELLKKAGILGVSFGLMASPLAFADTTDHSSIDQNQDVTVEDEPMNTQSGTAEPGSYDTEDLTTDHGTQGPDVVDEPESTNMSGGAEYTPEDVVEENSGS